MQDRCPAPMKKTAEGFDRILETYRREYEKAGLKTEIYTDIDEFIAVYKGDGSV